MTPAALEVAHVALPVADHGELVSALPFVLPAFLVVGVVVAMRAAERRGDDPGESR